MKILWVHNFNPKIKNSGVFMHQSLNFIRQEFHDIEIVELYVGNLRNPIIVFFSIIKIFILSFKYDVIHAQFGSMCAFVTSFAICKKYLTLRGSDWYKKKDSSFVSSLHNKLQNFLTNITMNRFDAIVVVSKRMRDEVGKVYNKKIIVIPSAVDLERFYPLDKIECRKKMNLPLDKNIILFPVMKITNPVKRPELIRSLKNIVEKNNIIVMTASGVNHQDMVFLFNAVDYVILPSMYEGWPNVIKEGLLCNTPFIATDVSDLSEIASRNLSCKIIEPNLDSILAVVENLEFKKDNNLRKEIEWMSLQNLNNKLVKELY